MPDEIHGIELYAEDNFSKTFKTYDKALKKAERNAESMARTIGKAGREMAAAWGTGVEDLTRRMDALSGELDVTRVHAQDLLAEMGAGEAAMGGLSSALTILGGVVAGIGIALGALGVVGAAIWSRMAEHVRQYISETEDVVEAQEAVNAEWERASEHLAQSLIPLKISLLQLEIKLAETVGRTAEAFKHLVALIHAPLAAGFAQLKELGQVAIETVKGQAPDFEEAWERIRQAGAAKFREVMFDYRDIFAEIRPEIEEEGKKLVPDIEPQWKRLADVVQNTFDRIRKLQENYHLQMQRAEEDAARQRARAWDKYEKQVAKAIRDGQKRLDKLEAQYEKSRTKAIADYQKRIAKAEADAYKARAKAQKDFERQERHTRQRFQLSQIQSERRYQFERNRLVAEGDTLAIEQLDERYEMEQKEAQENEALREKQEQENQAARIRELGEAAREQLRELEQQLAEQLREQEQNYHEQLETQRQANAERLIEMADDFAERQRLADEDRAIAAQRRQEDYERQLRDLGENLADQLREQGLHYGHVAALLREYYGDDGLVDAILSEFHARELERIAVTASAMSQLTDAYDSYYGPETRTAAYSPTYGMQRGGIVTGPATFHVEAGMREAVIPLGGSVHHTFDALNVGVTGLEAASPTDVSAIASAMARELTHQIRALRRS